MPFIVLSSFWPLSGLELMAPEAARVVPRGAWTVESPVQGPAARISDSNSNTFRAIGSVQAPPLLRVLDEPEMNRAGLGMSRIQFQETQIGFSRPLLVTELLGVEIAQCQ